jgi:integral membrane sensor domain MASE1
MERAIALRYVVKLAGVTALYFAAGRLGLLLAFLHPSASPVWPAAGLAMASLLLLGRNLWPAVFIGAFLVNLTTSGSVGIGLGIGVGNTLEAVAGAWLVARFARGTQAFEEPRDVRLVLQPGAKLKVDYAGAGNVRCALFQGQDRFEDFTLRGDRDWSQVVVPEGEVRVRIYTGDNVHGEREISVARGSEQTVEFKLGAS